MCIEYYGTILPGINYVHARNIVPLFKTLHSCNEKLGKLVTRVFSLSHVASCIELSIHLILNSQIILERKFFILTSTIYLVHVV